MKPASSPQPKKPKLVIKLSTKRRERSTEINVTEAAAPECSAEIVPVVNPESSEVKVQSQPVDDANVGKKEFENAGASSVSDGDKNSTAKLPIFAPDQDSGSTLDIGKAHSTARSGRKAAKLAAEKIAEKKEKKHAQKHDETSQKPEEDPWVQCDRCHKWRHLPAHVNVESLPEHWFCELNIYDPKRNNCEANEQTLKEVAKEKKRAKKLASKKLQTEEALASAEEPELELKSKGKKVKSSVTKSNSEKEAEFDVPGERSTFDSEIVMSKNVMNDDEDDETKTHSSGGESPKPIIKPKAKRGRPRREDKEKVDKNKDEPKQEWVQCEKCEKWRRLPPRISAADLPDTWYCSMNTWDINSATCTAIEDKHEASPARTTQYNEQSQIPTSFSGSKLSYRNLIFGIGRRQKNISERMRAQESLFSSQQENETDMSTPPTVMYANSKVFYNKNLNKASSFEDEGGGSVISVFDIVSHSRVWKELNNNASAFRAQSVAARCEVGYDRYCDIGGSLNQDAVDTLKAITFDTLGTKIMVGHEILLAVQCQNWNVPSHWMELQTRCTIEIITFVLDELVKDGLVEAIYDPDSPYLETAFYRRTPGIEQTMPLGQEDNDHRSTSYLKIRKPWKG